MPWALRLAGVEDTTFLAKAALASPTQKAQSRAV